MNGLHALLEELLQIMELELVSYRRLHELLQAAQQLIVSCQAETLAERLVDQEQILVSLHDLDRHRAARVEAIAERLGLPAEEHTTTGLAAHLAPAYAERMRGMARELLPMVEAIQRTNDDNRFLLRNSCAFLEATVKEIARLRAPRTAGLYGRGGHMKTNEQHLASALSINRQA